ncbi:hypothetical protein TWF569_011731 [Orbilia oligospora]|uniref:C2H2-type domain-containing protein n=1 Tax=Orbilia oligospora TaxID=2813651 RepID=A0A7C8JJ74_ORBOL|nr:hypothetical protein TWF706_002448 [Orbilia oligospora]KAF3086544.1 hypothetical protein TWF103_001757 [Orbilia oligospora]KAF3091275.1 hypothetical protein TWF102_008828 [Orbilia oligospora]KAF3119922.1 hypothetical protein TWF703_002986 [Orbilia oligospora]KAF3127585.1 hypothetical protein TWF569_011731 [Orbilia oligospora]
MTRRHTKSKMASSPASSELSSFSASPSPPAESILPIKRTASTAFKGESAVDDDATEEAPHSPESIAVSDVSSDTSGSVPGTPREDDEHGEQVTVCRWEGCEKDMGNMDDLVRHIHDEHIGTRRAKYACEWDDCTRKGMAHASGYALKAHMRSHTREKPFYCTLPECDRSFTRSDALAKHMRTVHETEALRPSDPIPKSHPNHPLNISAHLHDHMEHGKEDEYSSLSPSPVPPSDEDDDAGTGSTGGQNGIQNGKEKKPKEEVNYYEPEDGFDIDESKLPPADLYRLLRRKLAWAQEEAVELEAEKKMLEEKRRQAWVKKEMLLEKVIENDLGEDAKHVMAHDEEAR